MLWVTRFVASTIGEPALLMPGQCRTWQKEHMKTECDQPQHMLTRTSRGLFTDATSFLRAVPTRGAGQRALGRALLHVAVRVPAAGVP